MVRARHFPSRDRLSILTAVIVLAYALARFITTPTLSVQLSAFGLPLDLQLESSALLLVLVAALISTGSDSLIRSHPYFAVHPAKSSLIHWILPGTTALVLGAALNRLPEGSLWWLGLALSAFAIIAVLIAEYIVVDADDAAWDAAALGLTALAYALALILFTLLHASSAHPVLAAGVGGLVATGLTGRLFALKNLPRWRAALYAALVGLICAEAIWGLSYWRVASGSAALLLMVPFYVSLGLAQQHLTQRLARRVWVEFAVVGLAGLAAALFSARR
jgi:intracellular septation protein A